ncbi:MAG: response regulator transcription factor [Chitinophagaceae bacterium]|nr:response regulator transcription factor [Chitinophagaceae bacterium]
MQKQIRIILVDDHQVVRDSWKFLLDRDDRFTIIGQCTNGAEAIEQAGILRPDVMLMDINMTPINGFEATKAIIEQSPEIKIIGVSANNHPSYAHKILELGARGFVTKSSPFDELMSAIVQVYNGEEYVCREIRNEPSFRQR